MTATRPQVARSDRPRSRWSLRLGRPFGIEVDAHASLLALVAILAVVQGVSAGDPAVGAAAFLSLAAVFGCVLLHELGHALAARRYGVATRRILLLPIGGVALLDRMPERPREELVVALAGPAVNFVLAILAGIGLLGAALLSGPIAATLTSALGFLLGVNVLLLVFNLLPAFPMDGGRVLRALLAMRTSPLRATAIAARIGQAMAIGLGLVGLFYNPLLAIIALLVWFAAGRELLYARMKEGLRGSRVEQVMSTDFRTVEPWERLRDVAELSVRTPQRTFPVLRDGELVGMLAAERLAAAAAFGDGSSVGDAMRRDFDVVHPGQSLNDVFARLSANGQRALPVLDGARLVGLVTAEGLQRFLALRRTGAAMA